MKLNYVILLIVLGASFSVALKGQTLPGTYTSTWIGASTQDRNGDHAPVMQTLGLYVTSDGKSYTAQNWDESGPKGTVWGTNGEITDINLDVRGEGAIAVNSNYVFSQAGQFGFSRSNKSGGRNGDEVNVNTHVSGIAATDSEVFISCDEVNLIRVYDANTLGFLREYNVSAPQRSAAATDGSLWVISGTIPKIEAANNNANSNCTIFHIGASNGNVMATITGLQRPRGLALSSDNKLYVAEDGTDQNIKIYSSVSNLSGTVSPTPQNFGVVGGVFSGSGSTIGTMGELRFNHPTGVGVDADQNIYITQWATYTGGGCIISKFAQNGTRSWVRYGLMFEDGVDFDPTTDGVDVYGKAWHFKMDYTKSQGQEWSVVGYTHGRYKYEYDMRSHWFLDNPGNTWVRNITHNGQTHKILFVTRQTRADVQVFRFSPSTDGEVVIPCGEIADIHMPYDNSKAWPDGGIEWDGSKEGTWSSAQPALRNSVWTEGYIWSDLNDDAIPQSNEFTQPQADTRTFTVSIGNNGDLWMMDVVGNNMVKVPFQGFTSGGTPKWDYTLRTLYSIPAPFTNKLSKFDYDADRDIMVLTGITPEQTDDGFNGLGRSMARYNNWNANAGNWTASWVKNIPEYSYTTKENGEFEYTNQSHMPQSMTLEGDYIFVGYYGGYDVGGIYVMNLSDGNYTGKMLPDYDMFDCDELYCVSAFKRSNGEYVVAENHHSRAATAIFRWCPTGNCIEGASSGSLRNPENPSNTTNGMAYEYYENSGLNSLPDFNGLTPQKTGTSTTGFDMDLRNRDDDFEFRFTGYVNIPSDGNYTFFTTSDDGSRLYIGTTLVVDNDGLHGAIEKSGSIGLKAGKHAITVLFFEGTGDQTLGVSYEGSGLSKQIIPLTALYTTSSNAALSGYYKLIAKHSGKALDVAGAGTPNGTNVQQWTDNSSDAQQWNIELVEPEYYRLTNKVSGKCLDVSDASTADGGNIHQWSYVGADNQKWKIESLGDNDYKLTAKHSGKVVDVSGGVSATSDGANVHQWTFGDADNQKWNLTFISSSTSSTGRVTRQNPEASHPEESLVNALQVYPNPGGSTVQVVYTPEADQAVTIQLTDSEGRLVKRVFTGSVLQGVVQRYSIESGTTPYGMYFIRLASPKGIIIRKIILGGNLKN